MQANKLRSPIIWMGGKGIMADKIVKSLDTHKVYVEPFGGGASVLFYKNPSETEVYNDINTDLANLFQVLKGEDFEKFYRNISLTPKSKLEYNYCEKLKADTLLESVRRWYVIARQSFGGRFGAKFGSNIEDDCNRWLSVISLLPDIHERIKNIVVENLSWEKIFDKYDSKDTLFYCDPPYVSETRKSGFYEHEMTNEDHENFINRLLQLKAKVVLSGYDNPIYKKLSDNGWNVKKHEAVCHLAGHTNYNNLKGLNSSRVNQSRSELIWTSPNSHAGDFI